MRGFYTGFLDKHFTVFTGVGGHAAGFENPHRPQPFIDAYTLFLFHLSLFFFY
jgi:hypothetical protein